MKNPLMSFIPALVLVFLAPSNVLAQTSGSPVNTMVLIGGLALVPFFLMMVTSFVKIAVVLSLLRTAIGVQQAPPNQVITGLAVVLSIYVMAPVASQSYEIAEPSIQAMETGEFDSTLTNYLALSKKSSAPLKAFLVRHSDPDHRVELGDIARAMNPQDDAKDDIQDDDLQVAIPAFVLTELREAFIIGFLLFLPFIIVDLVVANVLLSLGMHMLSPTTISLPFKLLLFVLVDGWYLIVKGLLLGYMS